jgi:hypothetical protein
VGYFASLATLAVVIGGCGSSGSGSGDGRERPPFRTAEWSCLGRMPAMRISPAASCGP